MSNFARLYLAWRELLEGMAAWLGAQLLLAIERENREMEDMERLPQAGLTEAVEQIAETQAEAQADCPDHGHYHACYHPLWINGVYERCMSRHSN